MGPGQKDKDSFSKEAIDTLNVFLSENKDMFCCIIAGYEEELKKCFFAVNPGLERRFQWVHRIGEYTSENIADILLKMVQDIKWITSVSRCDFILLIDDNKHLFKNFGGDVENLLTKAKMSHAVRVFSLEEHHKFILTIEDFLDAINTIKKQRLNQQEEINNISLLQMYT